MKLIACFKDIYLYDRLHTVALNGWLWSEIELEQMSSSAFLNNRSAICIAKMTSYFAQFGKCVVLTDKRLDNNLHYSMDKGLLIISISNLIEQKSICAQISLLIFIWINQSIILSICNEECIFNINHNLSNICPSCEAMVATKIPIDALIRSKVLIKMMSLTREGSRKYLFSSLANCLTDLKINFDDIMLNYASTELILNEKFRVDSETRRWIEKSCEKIYKNKEQIFNSYISTNIKLDIPFFIASRRWNSWTPNQPRKELWARGLKTGGGYLLSDGDHNLVIDPGYGFLDMLYNYHDLTVTDINTIIVTHDHPDHSSDLQNILSLRFNYRGKSASRVRIILNPSSYYLFERLLRYHSELLQDGKPELLLPDMEFNAGKCKIQTIDVCHNEIYDSQNELTKNDVIKNAAPSKSIGLKIVIPDDSLNHYTIVIPGDTSFPNKSSEINRLCNFFSNADVICLHLGSLEKQWKDGRDRKASDIEYGNMQHLGLNGIIKFLNITKPKIVIISEFGEELNIKNFRLSITEIIKECLNYECVNILPSDFPLYTAFCRGEIFLQCHSCNSFVPARKITVTKGDNNFLTYHFDAGCESKLKHYTREELREFKS